MGLSCLCFGITTPPMAKGPGGLPGPLLFVSEVGLEAELRRPAILFILQEAVTAGASLIGRIGCVVDVYEFSNNCRFGVSRYFAEASAWKCDSTYRSLSASLSISSR